MARNKKRDIFHAPAPKELERDIYICSDNDCKEFGIISYLPGKCRRCKSDKLTREEWETWYGYDNDQLSSDDGPTLGRTLPSRPIIIQESFGKGYVNGTGNATTVVSSVAANDTWDAPACLSSCPVAPQAEIYIPDSMFKTWIDLAREFDTEWIAYLQGKAVEGQPFTYEVSGMTFPKQRANGAHVEILDGERAPAGTVAAVHSHVGMDVFFSQEDQKHFNWPIELVVNRKGELKANGLTTLDCGRQHRGDAKIWLLGKETYRSIANQLKAVLELDTSRSIGCAAPVQTVQITHVKG